MFDEYAPDPPPAELAALLDPARIEPLLRAAARRGEAMSYSGLLQALGTRFTRPRMRALCKALDALDRQAAERGEPELAALVVRESDRLPGQGWWIGRRDYQGQSTGPQARAYLEQVQRRAFEHWSQ